MTGDYTAALAPPVAFQTVALTRIDHDRTVPVTAKDQTPDCFLRCPLDDLVPAPAARRVRRDRPRPDEHCDSCDRPMRRCDCPS